MIGMMKRKSYLIYYYPRICVYSYSVRNGIRAGTINISEDYFLRCFYPYGEGDPDNIEKGFLRSGLLVKVHFIVYRFTICSLIAMCYNRRILASLFHPHPPILSVMKTKVGQQENSSVPQIHRGKQQNVMLQTF